MRQPEGRRPHAADLQIVAKQWQALTGLPLRARRANLLGAGVEREDVLFPMLADRAFDEPDFLEKLGRLSGQWLRLCPCATTRAIAAYAAYLSEDYGRAVTLLMACIAEEPDNLDTWLDLAFALNHAADPLGRHILFNHAAYIQRYPEGGEGPCSLSRLRALRAAIEAGADDYAQTWSRGLDGVEVRR
ncbi:MAG: hypothetical protein EB084_13735 [Proteobacteria bacterium]|nr:hypothetical protein [Pseudomonadota bacterium]